MHLFIVSALCALVAGIRAVIDGVNYVNLGYGLHPGIAFPIAAIFIALSIWGFHKAFRIYVLRWETTNIYNTIREQQEYLAALRKLTGQ